MTSREKLKMFHTLKGKLVDSRLKKAGIKSPHYCHEKDIRAIEAWDAKKCDKTWRLLKKELSDFSTITVACIFCVANYNGYGCMECEWAMNHGGPCSYYGSEYDYTSKIVDALTEKDYQKILKKCEV